MARLYLLLGVALAALAGVTAGPTSSGGAAGAAPPAPTCDWFAYDPNIATAGYCHLSDQYMLAVQPEPTTYIGM